MALYKFRIIIIVIVSKQSTIVTSVADLESGLPLIWATD